MQQRRLGRPGNNGSVAVLGGAAFAAAQPEAVARAFELSVEAGVNRLDLAPSYGHAEQLAGPVRPTYRESFFLQCKTMARDGDGAWRELERSLELLGTDHIDLHQLHAVTSEEELAAALAPGGAAAALVEMREQGVVRHIGLTGHFQRVARLFLKARQQVDLDTVMLPVNPAMLALPDYRRDLDEVFAHAAENDLGVLAIKAVARSPWPDAERPYTTWYRPHDESDRIQEALDFVLSFPVAGFAMPSDVSLLPQVLAAAARARHLPADERERRISSADPTSALVG